jgi:hypothetical protein
VEGLFAFPLDQLAHDVSWCSPVSQSDLIGAADAAAILGWSKAKVKRAAASGGLPVAGKMPGELGAYVFRRDEIEAVAAAEAVA